LATPLPIRSSLSLTSPHHPIELYSTDAKRWLLHALTTQHLKAFTSDCLLLQAKNNRELKNHSEASEENGLGIK
jgi:hypothetical protein